MTIKKCAVPLLMILFFCSIGFANYATEVASDVPIAWWRFNEPLCKDGATAVDVMGNIVSAIYHGDAMPVIAGIDETSCWFNGNQAGINLGNELGPLINGSSAVTFEAWIRNSILLQNGDIQRFFATRINGSTAGLDVGLIGSTDGITYIRVGARSISPGDSYLVASTALATSDQWMHLVCIRSQILWCD